MIGNESKCVIKNYNKINDYCNKYGEWPTYTNKKEKSEKEKESFRLKRWLYLSGYESGNFIFLDVYDVDGISIKDKLDKLYLEYFNINKDNIKLSSILERFRYIIKFIEKYNIWPRINELDKDYNGITSHQLYIWLYDFEYKIGDFKYNDLLYDNGLYVKDILDRLYDRYILKQEKQNYEVLKYYFMLKEYIKVYKKWPINNSAITSKDRKKQVKELIDWLNDSGYLNGKFKYSNVNDKYGVSIKVCIDELYKSIFINNENSNDIVIYWVNMIKEYFLVYQEWPKLTERVKKISNGASSHRLCYWLYSSGYMTREFIYKDLLDENIVNIKSIIDNLFIIFAQKEQIYKVDSNNQVMKLNLWMAKYSDSLEINLYYLFIKLKLSYIVNDDKNIIFYRENILNILEKNNIVLDINEIVNSFELEHDKQLEYFYSKYKFYYEKHDHKLTVLFKYLYEFEKAIPFKLEKTKKLVYKPTK